MLPDAGMRALDFSICGFVEAMPNRGLSVDALMVDVDVDDYMPATFGRCLRKEVVDSLRALGYQYI